MDGRRHGRGSGRASAGPDRYIDTTGAKVAAEDFIFSTSKRTTTGAESAPGNATYRDDLSVCYERLGAIAQAADDLATARSFFDKSLELRNVLAKADPPNGQLQMDVAVSHIKLARLALQTNDDAARRAHRDAAKDILDRLEREGRGKGDAQLAKLRDIVKQLGD